MIEKRKAVQISKETWDKIDQLSSSSGMTYKDIIDDAFGVNLKDQKAFKKSAIGQALSTPWVKDAISASQQGKLKSNTSKPDSIHIDVSILTMWRSAPTPRTKNRGTIKLRVMAKLSANYPNTDNWDDLYPRFTKDMAEYLSPFERDFAGRLRALVKSGFLINKDKGTYAIGKIKSSEWALIESIESIKPTRGISTHYGISSLLAKR